MLHRLRPLHIYNITHTIICLSLLSTALTAMPLKRKKTSLIEEAAVEETTKKAKRATLKVEGPEMKPLKAMKNGKSYPGLNIFNPVCPGRPGRGLGLAHLHLDCASPLGLSYRPSFGCLEMLDPNLSLSHILLPPSPQILLVVSPETRITPTISLRSLLD